MRPLFAIAPLALMLALIEPPQPSAQPAIAGFKTKALPAMPAPARQALESRRDLGVIAPPTLLAKPGALPTLQTTAFEAGSARR